MNHADTVELSDDVRVVHHSNGDCVVLVTKPAGPCVVLAPDDWRELARTLNLWAAKAFRARALAALAALPPPDGPKGAPSPEPPQGPNGPAGA